MSEINLNELSKNIVIIYADINIEITDGSTIWLLNLINTYGKENKQVYFLNVYKNTIDNFCRNIICRELFEIINCNGIDGIKNTLREMSMKYVGQIEKIIIRSKLLLDLIDVEFDILEQLTIYGLPIHLENILKLNNKFKEIWAQSEKIKDLYVSNGIQEDKIKITPPIGWKYDFELEPRTDEEIRLIYVGTLRDEENILEIIEEFQKIHIERPEVKLKIVYGKINGNKEFTEKIMKIIREGVEGVEFKKNLTHKETCYEIATSDIGICWRKNGWGEDGQTSTKEQEYKIYNLEIAKNLDLNLNIILDRYEICSYVLAYDEYEKDVFKKNLCYYNLNYKTINTNFNTEIADDILKLKNHSDEKTKIQIKENEQFRKINALIYILDDAIKNNHKNILLIDYDVYFHILTTSMLEMTLKDISDDIKIIYLGLNKSEGYCADDKILNTYGIILNKDVFEEYKIILESKLFTVDDGLIKISEKYETFTAKNNCIIKKLKSFQNNNNIFDKNINLQQKFYYLSKKVDMRLGIVVCYRSREYDLAYFLHAIKYILKDIKYKKIIIVNQDNDNLFSRGILFNIGEILIDNMIDYVVFHDVDLIPYDNYYNYDDKNHIKHLSKYVSQFKYLEAYNGIFGGVEYFEKNIFKYVNGFNNLIQGRGVEDDYIKKVICNQGLNIDRPNCYYISLPKFTDDKDLKTDVNIFQKARNISLNLLNNYNKKNINGINEIYNNEFKIMIKNFDYIDDNVIMVNVDFDKSYELNDSNLILNNNLDSEKIKKILNYFNYNYDIHSIFNINESQILNTKLLKSKYVPLISCILPVYNGYPDLKRSIESILDQSFKFFELIIVNDGSTDKTHDYIMTLNDERIVYINKKNEKLPAALNSGLEKCRGKYITWTSHDNYYHKDAFINFYTALETYPEVDYVYSSHNLFGNKNNTVNAVNQTILEFIFRFRGVCGFMWRKSMSDKIGKFDIELNGIEDFDYWIRILLENPKFLGIEKILYYYNVHENNMSNKLTQENKYLELDKKVGYKILQKYNNSLLDVYTFFPYLKYCYCKKSLSYAYYILGLSISNTTRKGFKEIFKNKILDYFVESYKFDKSFTPSLINIIICLKMNGLCYDNYLSELKLEMHNESLKKINIEKILNSDININNLYSNLYKYDLSKSELMIKKAKFMNAYLISDIISNDNNNHFNIGIVPSDPLSAYEKKGRGKLLQEYYNPHNFFSKAILFSPRENEPFFKHGIICDGKTEQNNLNKLCTTKKIDIIRGWGAYWPVDYISSIENIPTIISAHDTRNNFIYDNLVNINYIIPYSQSIADAIVNKFDLNISKKFYMLYNSVDENIFKEIDKNNEKILQIRNTYNHKYLIGIVGRLDDIKNHPLIINSINKLGFDYGLLCIGNGNSKIKNYVIENNINNVYFINTIENDELPYYYNSFDLLCHPSFQEGFGIANIEALMCNCVLLTSNRPAMNTYIIHKYNGYLIDIDDVNFSVDGYNSTKNLDKCINAINELLTNNVLYNNIKKNARASVINKFGENIKKNDEISIYRMILKDKNIVKKMYY